jgi:hypothetical protein
MKQVVLIPGVIASLLGPLACSKSQEPNSEPQDDWTIAQGRFVVLSQESEPEPGASIVATMQTGQVGRHYTGTTDANGEWRFTWYGGPSAAGTHGGWGRFILSVTPPSGSPLRPQER